MKVSLLGSMEELSLRGSFGFDLSLASSPHLRQARRRRDCLVAEVEVVEVEIAEVEAAEVDREMLLGRWWSLGGGRAS